MTEPRASLYTTPALAATFSATAHVAAILRFEAALARVQAGLGIIPHEAAIAIAAACRVEQYDVEALYREAAQAGTLVIPLVQALAAQAGAAGAYAHWGATSQDAIDTALMLQLGEGLRLIEAELVRLGDACAALAETHRETLMPGRTLLQQALPIPFGLKAARWLGLATRQLAALRRERAGLAVQLGGAAGTLAAMGDRGLLVAERLADELDLVAPALPWHAERDRTAALAAALGICAGAAAKIAQDLVLLAQTEVGEASEAPAPGKGGSSAMPQKRNPVATTLALAAARLAHGPLVVILGAMAHEHERAAGAWQAEWQALPELVCFTGGAVAHVADAVAGLSVDGARMRANLDRSAGLLMAEALTMALAPQLGRPLAQQLVQAACARAVAEGLPLHAAAADEPRIAALLPPDALTRTLDPARYLGGSAALIDRALGDWRAAGQVR